MRFTEEHQAIRATTAKFVDAEINPHADEWEAAGIFPAHEVFRKMGALGLLGIAKPDPRIFAAFADATGFPPSSILFFDDRAENVLGAGNAGWHARRIDHAGDTASQLLRHLGSFGITAR